MLESSEGDTVLSLSVSREERKGIMSLVFTFPSLLLSNILKVDMSEGEFNSAALSILDKVFFILSR